MLTKEEVRKIALLARLNLSEEEIERYQKELSAILENAKKLSEVNTDDVEPLYQVTGLEHVVREDCPQAKDEEMIRAMLEASPQGQEDNQFLVKNVL